MLPRGKSPGWQKGRPHLVEANPGFALTNTATMNLMVSTALVYEFVSQDQRLLEPEKTVLYAFARPQALVAIEAIMPTCKLDVQKVM